MKPCFLLGFTRILIAAALMIGCTTKFKDNEDGDADTATDTQADTEMLPDGTDPLPDGADGADLPADGDEEDGEPGRRIILERGEAVSRALGDDPHVYTCGMTENHAFNLRTLITLGRLYVVTAYEDPDASAGNEFDCAAVTSYSLPLIEQADTSEICGTPGENILADSYVPPVLFEDEQHLYLFEAVNDHSGSSPDRGNVRGTRFRKASLSVASTGYVFSVADRPFFSDIHANLCGDQAHVIVRTGESSPGADSDYFGFTLANDTDNHELDRMFDEGATRSFEEAGHFIDSTSDTRSIYVLGSECRESNLMLSAQEFKSATVIATLIIDFNTDLIRAGNHNWSEISICTSSTCNEADEPPIEGILQILLDKPPSAAMDKLFAAWISNEEPFGTLELPPTLVHAGGILFGDTISSGYSSAPITAPDDPARAYQPFPPLFECSTFKPHYFKVLYDSERDVLFITGVFHDYDPDSFASEALVGILALDWELEELAPPFFVRTGLPLMLNYEAALDEASGTLYLTWSSYESSTVDLEAETISAAIRDISITPVTYHDAD